MNTEASSAALAVDLGATSGRTVLATYDGSRIAMRELTRFDNPQIPAAGHLFWDLPHLYREVLRALTLVAQEGIQLSSIGIDTWGCDFACFGADGQLLGMPYCYRDAHTDDAMPRFFAEVMPAQEVYARTGIQFMPFNSLFQLHTLRREGSSALEAAARVLFIPDALIYMLTGEAVCEYTVATTSQMVNAATGDLDEKLLQAVGLRRSQMGRLVQPGERVGVLTEQVQAATGVGAVPVVAVGSHDTASAVAAVPAADDRFAYLSCGTWSLLGVETKAPVVNAATQAENFTNEGGILGTTRFLKNITGLWLLEQSRREWTHGEVPADINALNAMALQSTCQSIINPDDARFAHPHSMLAAIRDYLDETRQPLPQSAADYIRVIFRSLAHRYAEVIATLRRLTDVDIQRLHVIGGGSRNAYLMQFAADATGLTVVAGPQEGTALGNVLMQLRAQRRVDTLTDMRAIVARSVDLCTYTPGNK